MWTFATVREQHGQGEATFVVPYIKSENNASGIMTKNVKEAIYVKHSTCYVEQRGCWNE